jgi:GT2 family glycosyltransferase
MNSQVYILLPVHNRKDITLAFVRSVKKQTYPAIKLILIDDGSTDATTEAVLQEIPDTIVLRGTGNWWWGGSLNQGYKWLKKNAKAGDITLIINDDCFIEPDFIEKGVDLLKKNERSLILAYAYDKNLNKFIDAGVKYDFKANTLSVTTKQEEINCFSTRGLFLKCADFFSIGGFYPFLLPHYTSDYEFTIRAHKKGFKLLCFDTLRLSFDTTTSGLDSIQTIDNKLFIKQYFSKRYKENPVYLINYYLLAFPFPYNFKHAFKTFKQALRTIYSAITAN